MSDHHDLTLSIISYLLSDRRSDANTIHKIWGILCGEKCSAVCKVYGDISYFLQLAFPILAWKWGREYPCC